MRKVTLSALNAEMTQYLPDQWKAITSDPENKMQQQNSESASSKSDELSSDEQAALDAWLGADHRNAPV